MLLLHLFFLILHLPLRSTLFPYTTLFRSLFDRPAFSSVICHGIVLGEDGQKMSKSLRNYPDRKSTRLNSSHVAISYAVFCLKKKIFSSILILNKFAKHKIISSTMISHDIL